MEITGRTIEQIEDPFGILSGNRYEIFLHIEVPEDDELYSEKGLKVKVLMVEDEKGYHISHYHIIENTTEKVLDFELEEDEEQLVKDTSIEEIKKFKENS
jgi:hypothetical protein